MPLGQYEPTSAEALAFFVFTFGFSVAGLSISSISSAYQWRLWFKSHVFRPTLFHPVGFAVFRVLASIAAGVGVWFAWKDVFERENGLPHLSSGGDPTNLLFESMWMIAAVSAFMVFVMPHVWWICGVELKTMGFAVFLQVCTTGLVIALTVLSWQIYWLAGLLVLPLALEELFGLYLSAYFYRCDHEIFFNPISFIAETTVSAKFQYAWDLNVHHPPHVGGGSPMVFVQQQPSQSSYHHPQQISHFGGGVAYQDFKQQ